MKIDGLIFTSYSIDMINISKEAQQVLETIKKYSPIRSSELVKILNVSTKTIYKHLSILLDEELIKKMEKLQKFFIPLVHQR